MSNPVILITGASGFMGKNLSIHLSHMGTFDVREVNSKTPEHTLNSHLEDADIVVHFAGVNRPKDPKEFYEGNSAYTHHLVETLQKLGKKIPFIFTSSIHEDADNDYGKSKRDALQSVKKYHIESGAPVFIYKLSNTFGPHARTNLHSVIATFCYNISHNIPININDPKVTLNLIYIDDLVESITNILTSAEPSGTTLENGYLSVTTTYPKTLGYIADTLISFNELTTINSKDITDPFEQHLYTTYCFYKDQQ